MRPDDRAVSRASSSSLNATGVSPDDRAFPLVVEPTPVTPVQVVVEPRGGFSWADAAVGAAGAIGLAALLAGFGLLGLRFRRDPASTLGAGVRSA